MGEIQGSLPEQSEIKSDQTEPMLDGHLSVDDHQQPLTQKGFRERFGEKTLFLKMRMAGVKNPEQAVKLLNSANEQFDRVYISKKSWKKIESLIQNPDIMSVWEILSRTDSDRHSIEDGDIELLDGIASKGLSKTLIALINCGVACNFDLLMGRIYDSKGRNNLINQLEIFKNDPALSAWLQEETTKTTIASASKCMRRGLEINDLEKVIEFYKLKDVPDFELFLDKYRELGTFQIEELSKDTSILSHPNLFSVLGKMHQHGYMFGYLGLENLKKLLNDEEWQQDIFSEKMRTLSPGLKQLNIFLNINTAGTLSKDENFNSSAIDIITNLNNLGIRITANNIDDYFITSIISTPELQEKIKDSNNIELAKRLKELGASDLELSNLREFLLVGQNSQEIISALESDVGREIVNIHDKISYDKLIDFPLLVEIPNIVHFVQQLKTLQVRYYLSRPDVIKHIQEKDSKITELLQSPQLGKLIEKINESYAESYYMNKVTMAHLSQLNEYLNNPQWQKNLFDPKTIELIKSMVKNKKIPDDLSIILTIAPHISIYTEIATKIEEKFDTIYHAEFPSMYSEKKDFQREFESYDSHMDGLTYLLENPESLDKIFSFFDKFGKQSSFDGKTYFSFSNLRAITEVDKEDEDFFVELKEKYQIEVDKYTITNILVDKNDRVKALERLEYMLMIKSDSWDKSLKINDLKKLLSIPDEMWDGLIKINELPNFHFSYDDSADFYSQLEKLPEILPNLEEIQKKISCIVKIFSTVGETFSIKSVIQIQSIDLELLEQIFRCGVIFTNNYARNFFIEKISEVSRSREQYVTLSQVLEYIFEDIYYNSTNLREIKTVEENNLLEKFDQISVTWGGDIRYKQLIRAFAEKPSTEKCDQCVSLLCDYKLIEAVDSIIESSTDPNFTKKKIFEALAVFASIGVIRGGDFSETVKLITFIKDDHIKNILSQIQPKTLNNLFHNLAIDSVFKNLLEHHLMPKIEKLSTLLDFFKQRDFSDDQKEELESYADNANDIISLFSDQSILDEHKDDKSFANNYYKFFVKAIPRNVDCRDLIRVIKNVPFVVDDENSDLHAFIFQNLPTLSEIPENKIKSYITIAQKIAHSPSQEIQRIRDQLLEQLILNENPEALYDHIEKVFIENNLPLVGKIYRIFEYLYPQETFLSKIQTNSSPVLQKSSYRSAKWTIYKDLLNIHIKSGNRSLRNYIEIFDENGEILDRLQNTPETDTNSLSDVEKDRANYLMAKLETLFANSQLGKRIKTFSVQDKENLQERIQNIFQLLQVRNGQSIRQRVEEMFLRPIGLEDTESLLLLMRESKQQCDERNRGLVAKCEQRIDEDRQASTHFSLEKGDLMKGIGAIYFRNILQNGSVATEFLGANSGYDSTPFDTDASMVLEEDVSFDDPSERWQGAYNATMATSYGSIILVVKDRGQFEHTNNSSNDFGDRQKIELFTISGRHHGIRTGFPTSEIDFIIVKDDQRENLDNLFFEILQNGYYIPICDQTGKLLFTPEQFDERRKIFEGLSRFDGGKLDILATQTGDLQYQRVSEIMTEAKQENENINQILSDIRQKIGEVLQELGINLKPELSSSILGAELLDTGSSGRRTNMTEAYYIKKDTPHIYDFDLALKLDNEDFEKIDLVVSRLKQLFIPKDDSKSHPENRYYQMRMSGISLGENEIDIDIGIAPKSELSVYGTHDAVSEKLAWIRENNGEGIYQQVLANIIMAKELLAEGHAYKKIEDGGLGGVGVENWILQHNGNLVEAFKAFRNVAYLDGARKSFAEFQQDYRIIDPGINIKTQVHDNFIVKNLKEEGYNRMLDTIDGFLR